MGFQPSNALSAIPDVHTRAELKSLWLAFGSVQKSVSTLIRNNQAVVDYTPSSITLTAGSGLTGGGDLTADRSFAVGAGTGITVAADSVSISSSYLGANPTASVGLTAVNGSATSYMRSDGAPALDVGIVPTWTGIHTFSAQDVHNAGVSLGTSGRINSAVADAASSISILQKPSVALTSNFPPDRYVYQLHDSAGTVLWSVAPDGTVTCQTSGQHSGTALLEIGQTASALASSNIGLGIKFGPKWGATAGVPFSGSTSILNAAAAGYFSAADNSSATATALIGGYFTNQSVAARTHASIIGGMFNAFDSMTAGAFAHGNLYGWLVRSCQTAKNSTATAAYGGYIEDVLGGTTPVTTNQYGFYVAEQTRATNKYGAFFATATAGYKAIAIRDTNTYFHSSAAATMDVTATQFNVNAYLFHTGAQAGFFNVGPVTRPTAFTQTYSTASKTHPNMTAAAVATTASTNTTPYGYTTSAQADDIITQLNKLITDVTDLKKVVNAIIDDGQALGLLQ